MGGGAQPNARVGSRVEGSEIRAVAGQLGAEGGLGGHGLQGALEAVWWALGGTQPA